MNGTEGIEYSVYAEVFYADGSNESIVAPFVIGDHDYQLSQLIFTPSLPITRITFHCNFQMKGTAYFDRVSLQQKIPGNKFQLQTLFMFDNFNLSYVFISNDNECLL